MWQFAKEDTAFKAGSMYCIVFKNYYFCVAIVHNKDLKATT